MLIERIWAANELRNYQYLIASEASGEALAVDPLNAADVLARARERGWTITQILNTHEHLDHTAGNAGVVAATGARVMAHAAGAARIGGVDRALQGGDAITLGRDVHLQCLDTPGHTMAHICLYAPGDAPLLFSGDTLFNAGVGNCRGGGDPASLYRTCSEVLAKLPPGTRLHPGHDYLRRNLEFTLDLEPGNAVARALHARTAGTAPEAMPVLTLAEELAYNTFFRLREAELVENLRRRQPALGPGDPRSVFLALRELRNSW
ncbi:MAG: hydroxyacylglutathione hydrolase [Steroidobacteraceae bacterium]